jgi:Mce-associated membrane protein
MSNDEGRTLKLVKGGASTASRSTQRRAAVRRSQRAPREAARRDTITELLERLDEEPVREPASPASERRAPERRPSERRAPVRRSPRRASPRRRRPQWTTVVAAVALCCAVVAASLLGFSWYRDRELDRAHQQAVAAARQTTVNFVSVSASSVDRDLQRILAGATGDFKDEFSRGQSQVRSLVVENNVESRGTVLRAALVSGDRRTAVVLVAVDATVKNTKAPDGRVSHYRIQVDVAHVSGHWLVSRLQFVG